MMAALLLGVLLDLMFGDPHWLWHPVQGIGTMVKILEGLYRRIFPKTDKGELAAGGCMVVSVLCLTACVSGGALWLAGRLHPAFGFLVEVYFCYSILAARSLYDESMQVYEALRRQGLEAGRQAVSRIVGRDTGRLSKEGVVRAAVETVAENTSDGVVAPLFYLALLGPVGGWLYKAVNTMDSMVGYKTREYLYFGRMAARLDDVCNYIPSRLSALLMLLAGFLFRYDYANAYRIFRRDRLCHASPNSAQTEAVMAGALGVRLAGDAYYFGRLVKKPTIGDADREIEPEDIGRAGRLMLGTAALGLVLCIGTIYMGNILRKFVF